MIDCEACRPFGVVACVVLGQLRLCVYKHICIYIYIHTVCVCVCVCRCECVYVRFMRVCVRKYVGEGVCSFASMIDCEACRPFGVVACVVLGQLRLCVCDKICLCIRVCGFILMVYCIADPSVLSHVWCWES